MNCSRCARWFQVGLAVLASSLTTTVQAATLEDYVDPAGMSSSFTIVDPVVADPVVSEPAMPVEDTVAEPMLEIAPVQDEIVPVPPAVPPSVELELVDSIDEGVAPVAEGGELSEELLPEAIGNEAALPVEAVPTTRILSADGEDAIVSAEENQLDETLEPLSETVSLTEEPLSVSGGESIALPAEAVPRTRIFSARIFSGGEELVDEESDTVVDLLDGEPQEFDEPMAQSEEVAIPDGAIPTTITMLPESIIPSVRSEGGLIAQAVPNGVVPDATLGVESSMVTPNVEIKGEDADLIEGGATRGSNLFHSFEDFSIEDGQRVYFADPDGIENILSRVTGGNVSEIDGLLGVDGTANLFLLNPNGVLFGPDAELDIRGSFTASTAGSINFADDSVFSAVNPQGASLLTTSVPLGVQRGGQQPQGDITNEGDLAVATGTLTLFGDNINSSGGLTALGRNVRLIGNQVTLSTSNDITVGAAGTNDTTIRAEDINVDEVNTLLETGDLTLETDKNLNWNADATLTNDTERTLELRANNSILFNESLMASEEHLNVTLNSDRDNSGEGAIVLTNATINSNGGNITLRGGSDPLDRSGRNLPANEISFNINEPLGTINNLLTSENASLDNPNDAYFAPGTLARNIFARGVSQGMGGISLEGSNINAGKGNILMLGGGADLPSENTADSRWGIRIVDNSSVTTNSSGKIRLIGLGGLGTTDEIGDDKSSGSIGLRVGASSEIVSQDGNIQLTGYAAGVGTTDVGIWILDRSTVHSNGSGNIVLTGISDSTTGFNNEGISVFNRGRVEASGTGNIDLTGIGAISHIGNENGTSNTNPGIHISISGLVQAKGGNVHLTGVGRAIGDENYGVQLNDRGIIEAEEVLVEVGETTVEVGGNITITGVGGKETSSDEAIRAEGIRAESGSSIRIRAIADQDINTINLTADEITLQGENVVDVIEAEPKLQAELSLQPYNTDLNIVIGGALETNVVASSTLENQLHLSTNDLNALGNGFSRVLIGNPNVPIIRIVRDESFQDSVFRDPVELRAMSIDTLGDSTDQDTNENTLRDATILGIDDASVTLIADRDIRSPNIIAPGQFITLNSLGGSIFITNDHSIFARPTGDQRSRVNISGDSLIMTNGAIDAINSEGNKSEGNEGNSSSITVNVKDSVSLLDSSILSLTTSQADANDIQIIAGGNISLRGVSSINTISSLSNGELGNGGNILIEANSLNLDNGGQLSASTFSNGNAGNITIDVDEGIHISGVNDSSTARTPLTISFSGTLNDTVFQLGRGESSSNTVTVPQGDSAIYYQLKIEEPGTAAVFKLDDVFSPDPTEEFTPRMLDMQNNVVELAKRTTISTNTSLEIFDSQGQLLISDIGVPDSLESTGYIFFEKPGDYFIRVSTREQTIVFDRVNDTGADLTETLVAQSLVDLKKIDGNPVLQVSLIDTLFRNTSGLFSTTTGLGRGGDIAIGGESSPVGSLSITNGGLIDTATFGRGNAGDVHINVRDDILVDGSSQVLDSEGNPIYGFIPTGIFSRIERGEGGDINRRAGDITLNGESLTISNGGFIDNSTLGRGNAGNVIADISGPILLNNGQISSNVGFDVTEPNLEEAIVNRANGDAGNITIRGESLYIQNGAFIDAAVFGEGNAGNISINATNSVILEEARILLLGLENATLGASPSAVYSRIEEGGRGIAGTISIETPKLSINDGEITTSTFDITDEYESIDNSNSSITIRADKIELSNDIIVDSGIFAETFGSAPGGNIIFQPYGTDRDIEIHTTDDGNNDPDDDPRISASTRGSGPGGSISIENAEVVKLNHTQLRTSSGSENSQSNNTNPLGRAGDITIQADDVLFLREGSLIQAGANGNANGGKVDINADFVITVPSEDNDILANAIGGGDGGKITINANRIIGFEVVEEFSNELIGNGRSDISARADEGIDGQVNLNNFLIDPNQGLNELPETVEDPSDRIARGCHADLSGDSTIGNFAITGRSGQPLNPANIASDTSTLDDLGPIDAQAESSPSSPETIAVNTPPPVIEDAQKAIRTDSGEIRLVAQGSWHSSVSCSDLH